MDRSQIVRNSITAIFNDQNEGLFKLNQLFFYDVEDGLLKNDQMNFFLKTFCRDQSPSVVYKLFIHANHGEEGMLFFDHFKTKLHAFLECDPATADVETELFPIHSIFYRFFIKGGAALKIFVDNLESLGIIGEFGTVIPTVANAPTDIDSTIVVNPAFSEAPTFIIILKEALRQECLKIMAKYSSPYWYLNDDLIKTLQKNAAFLKETSDLFHTEVENMVIAEPSRDEMRGPNTVKPENSCVRLSVLNPPVASICLYRVLMCVDIYDVHMEIDDDNDSKTVGRRISNPLILAEAELIDITMYEMNNPKLNDMWEWAKHAMPFDARHTLFQDIHQMMIDIIQMNQTAVMSGNPSLVSKLEKRQQRLNYLYFLYCNYIMIQHIVENKSKIKEQHIVSYCHHVVEDEFLRLGLTPLQINEILPYIIGKRGIPLEQIINEFIKTHILHDQSMDYELSMHSGLVVSSKYEKKHAILIFPQNAIQKIVDYVRLSFPAVSAQNKALALLDLVAIMKESRSDGNVHFVLISAILDACGVPPLQFTTTVRTIYKSMIKNIKLAHKSVFSSKEYHQIIQNRQPVPVQIMLNENIGNLCQQLIDKIQIYFDVVLLNKYAPFKVLILPKMEIPIVQFLEVLFNCVHEYLNRRFDLPFIITYEMHPEFILNVFFRLPFNKTIKAINLKGFAEIHFCKFIIKYQHLQQNIFLFYRNGNKSFYQIQ
jgi:hypothetical protein